MSARSMKEGVEFDEKIEHFSGINDRRPSEHLQSREDIKIGQHAPTSHRKTMPLTDDKFPQAA